MSDKRTDYISWDEYFMGVAKLASMRSKDPSTQVGACIVDKDNYILSVGYNGFLMLNLMRSLIPRKATSPVPRFMLRFSPATNAPRR